MNTVNQGVRKLDAMQLVTGQPVYTEDIAPENCLVVKLLRSPHANAVVREIDTERAADCVLDEFRAAKIGRISLERPETATAEAPAADNGEGGNA